MLLTAVAVNLILFLMKLYVGLSSNSISIYSDGVNNMLDSLSGLIVFCCMLLTSDKAGAGIRQMSRRLESLLSLMLGIILLLSGAYFGYCSVERLMYPTPIWYLDKYLYILLVTVAAKLGLYLLLRASVRKNGSKVIRLISVDCVLDLFITLSTVLSLVISGKGTYSFDGICGLVIGILITVNAIASVKESFRSVIGYVPDGKREKIKELLDKAEIPLQEVSFDFINEKEGYAQLPDYVTEQRAEKLMQEIERETGIAILQVKKGKEKRI